MARSLASRSIAFTRISKTITKKDRVDIGMPRAVDLEIKRFQMYTNLGALYSVIAEFRKK